MADGDLATLEAVRAFLRGSVPVPLEDEPVVATLITAVSEMFVSATSCEVLTASRTDTFDGTGAAERWLAHYPVVSVESVDVDGEPVSERAAIGEDGWVLSDADGGKLELVGSCFTRGVKNCVVVYTAGYGATPPADVAQAIVDQVAYLYKMKDRIGITNESTQSGGAVTYLGGWTAQQGKDGLTPLFAATVARYRRVS
jgi:hypothetical protein